MKTIKRLCVISMLIIAVSLSAQTDDKVIKVVPIAEQTNNETIKVTSSEDHYAEEIINNYFLNTGGIEAWKASGKDIDTLTSVSADVLEQKINEEALVFDVRKPGEYAAEHIENVSSTPLDFLNDHISEFPTNKDFYVHCAGGYRSVIASSILKARGFNKVIDVAGGYAAIRETGIKRTDVVSCSSSK